MGGLGAAGADGVTRIIAIRHGETPWNLDQRIQGQTDIGLNAHGRWQAGRMAQALADEQFDVIYSSDLSRALHTADALASRTGATIVTDPGLRERAFGEFEGFTVSDIADLFPEGNERWRRREPDFGPTGGETLARFYQRCVDTLTRLAAQHPGGSIAFVSHGGVLDCLYRHATGLELQAPRSWQLANAGINRLLYTGEFFTIVGWADTMHLDDTSDAPRVADVDPARA